MMPLAERFWSKVAKAGPGECWLWTAGCDRHGYGKFYPGIRHGAKNDWTSVASQRIAWALTYGPVPEKLHVLHRCDVRSCCNPEHLFVGTHQDNLADMVAKGRQAIGHGKGRKLTAEAVLEIRRAISAGTRPQSLCEKYGVGPSTISMIRRGKIWAHLISPEGPVPA